ncbi:phosphodiesterase [Mycobacterium noviomagense]|uniref:Phosphodiesterase n=1 Tax=Mycobacterium noviomagense TaxID=459858 RepID=A0A7I7PFX6_9MYCO|nr:phosphodiesterase [Mycobacterium noviomagense]ORB16095.1 phosphodiesterase [Mycobacterium noviomagense]BBY07456.1 hypothetical protein MNVI_27740 [Mycobacterium noviomagense]
MNLSDIVAVPLKWGSALRHRRVFHPVGVLAGGSLERLAPPDQGLPIRSCDVVARISKGAGTPGALPDIIGLAWKMPPTVFPPNGWDVLLASAGAGRLARIALHPVTSWSASMSSLMPLCYEQRYWWIRAQLSSKIGEPGVSLESIRKHIDQGGIEFNIEQACGTGRFEPLAVLSVNRLLPDDESHDVLFDPTINAPPDVTLAPGWLTSLRRRAYDRSREGRDAD